MTVQPGDFCVVPISGPVGKLISIGEWLNGSGFHQYDHAEIFVGNPTGHPSAAYGYTFGAYPGGASYLPLTDPPDKVNGVLWSSNYVPLTDDERNIILANCDRLIGTPYSSLDYFALAAHRFHLPIPLLKEYIASTKHMICSQMVDYIYQESGVNLFKDNRWPGYVTPADLAQLIGGAKDDESGLA